MCYSKLLKIYKKNKTLSLKFSVFTDSSNLYLLSIEEKKNLVGFKIGKFFFMFFLFHSISELMWFLLNVFITYFTHADFFQIKLLTIFFSLTRCNADFHEKIIKILIYLSDFIYLHLISNPCIFYMYVCKNKKELVIEY